MYLKLVSRCTQIERNYLKIIILPGETLTEHSVCDTTTITRNFILTINALLHTTLSVFTSIVSEVAKVTHDHHSIFIFIYMKVEGNKIPMKRDFYLERTRSANL